MAWITVTPADVQNRLAAAELNALKTAAKASSQDGDVILSEAIDNVVAKVRGYVAACERNLLGLPGTIPEELLADTLALIRDYLFTRLPGMRSLNDELRQRETERAERVMRDVARCDFAIVPPEQEAPQQAAGPSVQIISSRKQIATRKQTSGLL